MISGLTARFSKAKTPPAPTVVVKLATGSKLRYASRRTIWPAATGSRVTPKVACPLMAPLPGWNAGAQEGV